MADHYQNTYGSHIVQPKPDSKVLLPRAIRRALRELGPDETAKLVIKEFNFAAYPKHLRRHL